MVLKINFILLIVFFLCRIVYGNSTTKYLLKKQLFDNYDCDLPPSNDTGLLLIVTAEMYGAVIIEVKETEQVSGYLLTHIQKWVDPRLAWKPEKYGGVTSITVPLEKVWRPDTYIYNSVEVKDLINEHLDLARIKYTGEVDINCPQYVQAFCTIAVHMFPFDTQFCTIAITSNQVGIDVLNFTAIHPDYQKFKFTGNAEWDLCNVSVAFHQISGTGLWGADNSIEYQYIFQIKRRPTYYITVIIIPLFLISTLSIVGIFAPGSKNETGNCVNLGLCTLLALMVLLGIIAERLPKSDDVPLLGYYILISLISFVFCVIFETMMIYYSHSLVQSGKSPPSWLYKLTRVQMKSEREIKADLMEKARRKHTIHKIMQDVDRSKQPVQHTVIKNTISNEVDDTLEVLRSFIGEQRKVIIKCEKEKDQYETEAEWEKVEVRVDFFWIFFFECMNVLNLVFLLIMVSVPAPTIDEWLDGKSPIELLTS